MTREAVAPGGTTARAVADAGDVSPGWLSSAWLPFHARRQTLYEDQVNKLEAERGETAHKVLYGL